MSHNILAPSAAHRWLHCTASIPETLGAIDEGSVFADEGTAAHTMASWCLSNKRAAKDYPDAEIHVYGDPVPDKRYASGFAPAKVRNTFKADDEMKSFVQVYLDAINDRVHDGATLMVEQRLSSGLQSMLFGPADGTTDVILIAPQFKLIEVHDLKYGKGISVSAKDNAQLRVYGLGGVRLAEALGFPVADWQVRMVIHQPRLDSMTDDDMPVRELRAWGEQAQSVLDQVDMGLTKYEPREDVCKWCPKKATCVALANYVANTIASEFPPVEDMTDWGIGKALDRLPLIEQWVKAVRSAGWAALNAGQKIPGWKLAQGRQGNRKWVSPEQVEAIFKERYRMTYEEMYEAKLITPTEAEKRMKKTNPRRWEDLQEFIKREPGQLTMVREGDDRPAHDLADEMAKQ